MVFPCSSMMLPRDRLISDHQEAAVQAFRFVDYCPLLVGPCLELLQLRTFFWASLDSHLEVTYDISAQKAIESRQVATAAKTSCSCSHQVDPFIFTSFNSFALENQPIKTMSATINLSLGLTKLQYENITPIYLTICTNYNSSECDCHHRLFV